jgi:hypothetical protein
MASNSKLVLSWLVPSASYVLQQNFDFNATDWAEMTNAVTLNLTNLENQVVVSPTDGRRFYRLIENAAGKTALPAKAEYPPTAFPVRHP